MSLRSTISAPIRRRTARLVATVAAIGMTAALAGCASDDDERTTLQFFSWDNAEVMQPLIDEFEAANPEIRIEFTSAPPVAEYVSTLQTRLLSGTAADVFVLGAENKTNVIEGGYALDLTDAPFMDVVAEPNLVAYAQDDRVYAMSTSSWAGGLLYNRAILEENGITDEPTTWSELLDDLQTLADAGVVPIYDQGQQVPFIVNALLGAENERLGGDVDARIFEGAATFADLWTQPLSTFGELLDQQLLTPDVIGLTGDQIVEEFVNGRVAMISAGPWNLPVITESAPDIDLGFMGVPGASEGQTFWAGAASPGYAINSATDTREEAEAFLAYLASDEGISLYNAQTSAMTTTTNVTPEIAPVLEPALAAVQGGEFYLAPVAWPRYQDLLSTEVLAQLQLFIQGSNTVQDVTAAMQTRLDAQG